MTPLIASVSTETFLPALPEGAHGFVRTPGEEPMVVAGTTPASRRPKGGLAVGSTSPHHAAPAISRAPNWPPPENGSEGRAVSSLMMKSKARASRRFNSTRVHSPTFSIRTPPAAA